MAEIKTTEGAAKPVHDEYIDWRLLSVSHREDKKTLRAILANDTAVAAARKDQTKPWPDGSILAKVVWKESIHPNWSQAIVPGEFTSAEAMLKTVKNTPIQAAGDLVIGKETSWSCMKRKRPKNVSLVICQ